MPPVVHGRYVVRRHVLRLNRVRQHLAVWGALIVVSLWLFCSNRVSQSVEPRPTWLSHGQALKQRVAAKGSKQPPGASPKIKCPTQALTHPPSKKEEPMQHDICKLGSHQGSSPGNGPSGIMKVNTGPGQQSHALEGRHVTCHELLLRVRKKLLLCRRVPLRSGALQAVSSPARCHSKA